MTRAVLGGGGQAAHGAQVGVRELRPGGGHVQAAVLGEAGEEDAGEVAHGGLATGGDVAHGWRYLDRDRVGINGRPTAVGWSEAPGLRSAPSRLQSFVEEAVRA